jgi:hypothetical protein
MSVTGTKDWPCSVQTCETNGNDYHRWQWTTRNTSDCAFYFLDDLRTDAFVSLNRGSFLTAFTFLMATIIQSVQLLDAFVLAFNGHTV